jgi:hypothetical protein
MTASPTYLMPENAHVHTAENAVGCPMCGGAVRPQRSGWQCVRCGFTICEGCEGGAGECDTEG